MNAPVQNAPRHFLGLLDLTSAELRRILDLSAAMKRTRAKGVPSASRPLAGKTLAMIFDRPSTRTRVSFDIGMRELGGETIMLTGAEMQLGRGETIADTARVLSRYVEAIVIRILSQGDMLEMAANATVPVINGLTKQSHPCQAMADILTFEEKRGPIRDRKIAWSGDYNNVLSSWIDASARFGFTLDIACPRELQPTPAAARGRSRRRREHHSARGSAGRSQGRGGGDFRLLGIDGRRGRGPAPEPASTLSGQQRADDPRGVRRHLPALPARPSGRGGDRRGDRRPPIGCVG